LDGKGSLEKALRDRFGLDEKASKDGAFQDRQINASNGLQKIDGRGPGGDPASARRLKSPRMPTASYFGYVPHNVHP
jgi:hypothetical protein